jgi:hypothetical protein
LEGVLVVEVVADAGAAGEGVAEKGVQALAVERAAVEIHEIAEQPTHGAHGLVVGTAGEAAADLLSECMIRARQNRTECGKSGFTSRNSITRSGSTRLM